MYHGDSRDLLGTYEEGSVDLIMTSPPFGLVREKEYGNVASDEYLEWFQTFAEDFYNVLSESGSLVIDIGGSWIPGKPTRSLYHFKLMIMLVEEFGFHLAQEFYWWNPSRLPTPAEWVTIRRIRAKDAVNTVWWLSKTPYPKASNRRVLQPYSESQQDLFEDGYEAKKRPSGHDISEQFSNRNKGSIPPNLLAVANTSSNNHYQRYCRENDIDEHPARYPDELPEFFVRMLTDKGDTVVDPFAGSCVTGGVCERLERNWVCIDTNEEYLRGAMGRFTEEALESTTKPSYYAVPKAGSLWNKIGENGELPEDGGRSRPSNDD
jgi:site-specific DNA-methyltransferase (cytosine-N4-specific)